MTATTARLRHAALTAALLTTPALLTLPAAPAGAKAATRSCGKITPPYGARVKIVTQGGPSCNTAKTVLRSYYRRAKAGTCRGNICIAQIGSYRCSTATVGVQAQTGISTRCQNRNRSTARILTK